MAEWRAEPGGVADDHPGSFTGLPDSTGTWNVQGGYTWVAPDGTSFTSTYSGSSNLSYDWNRKDPGFFSFVGAVDGAKRAADLAVVSMCEGKVTGSGTTIPTKHMFPLILPGLKLQFDENWNVKAGSDRREMPAGDQTHIYAWSWGAMEAIHPPRYDEGSGRGRRL